ncbi:hypothetical protein [Spirosoma foliorum]|uniref:Uncharacterized protein n=1 Tax=Spirosoma foliorum TaxID=2710596 RepID=A0A7G5GRH8_9BACT|nr:hypothetical protein [Spirosoma foliorum]QMW01470.1 hypothetical protein H3H32_26435 [Spirosoma foliorum]
MTSRFALLLSLLAPAWLLLQFRRKLAFSKQCPRCKNPYPDRTSRPRWMKGRGDWLPLKAYYCTKCRHCFYRFDR